MPSSFSALLARMKHLIAYSAAAAVVASILVAPGGAGHGGAEYQCNNIFAGASNNTTHWAGFDYTFLAQWDNIGPGAEHLYQNTLDYIARRQDGDFNPTYTQWNAGHSPDRVYTSGYSDQYRRTGVQRAGYAFDYIGGDDWSGHGNCIPGGPFEA